MIDVKPRSVTVYNEYVAQTQAPATIEIRSQVTGLLERQAFTDGARVKKGDLLYVIDQRPFEAQLAQAKASLAQAEANRVNAQQNLARNSRLIAQKAVSQQDYDTAVAQERSSAALVEAQNALVRATQLNLEFATMRAPRDGFMSSSQVKPGSLINAQQTLLTTLYSSDPMWVYFSDQREPISGIAEATETSSRRAARLGSAFHLRLADGTDYALPGKLNFVDATLDQKSGTLQVRISVPNPDRVLRPGLFVRVTVPAFENPNAIRIPQQAVQELQGMKSVYVVAPDDKAEPRQIAASYRVENDWVVDNGLKPGDRVVIEGIGKLRPGTPVKPVAAVSVAGDPMAGTPPAAPKNRGGRHAAALCATTRARSPSRIQPMFNFFIERPVFSTVIALIMVLVGVLSALDLPIAQYPQVVPPQVTVTTNFPGANADVVAQSVAAPIEQQVNGSQGMLYMASKSGNDGSYNLTVTFEIGTDKNIDAVEVQNRVAIAQSQLPADVIRNGITVRKSTTDFLELISLTSPERQYDARIPEQLRIAQPLRRAGPGARRRPGPHLRRPRLQHAYLARPRAHGPAGRHGH